MNKVKFFSMIHAVASQQKPRYLLVGAWNTLFGYFCAVTLYYYFGNLLGVIVVGVISNILSISMSFFTYKVMVFRTRGNWLKEYLKAYLVYGLSSLIGILILYIGVDGLNQEFWIVQAFAIVIVTLVTYLSHSRFTFNSKKM
jgi:putative flippase GtrA